MLDRLRKPSCPRWPAPALALAALSFCLAVAGGRQLAQAATPDSLYWAFQPIHRPAVPSLQRGESVTKPIDAFVLAQLEAKGLTPNPRAENRQLIRRAYFDLIGLPPTPQEVERFVADGSPDAFPKLIDRLLAMPQYGERWGRFWLDVVRYGETNGYERDGPKPYAWRYRDYVISSLNQDKPYDRFIKEQLAGDELTPATAASIVATGFYRLGVWDDEPDDRRTAEYDELDDIVRTTGTAFLGLTINCARCHDHKFDPIPQTDYYSMVAFFRNIRPYESENAGGNSSILRPLASTDEWSRWKGMLDRQKTQLHEQILSVDPAAPAERKRLELQLQKLSAAPAPFPKALAVRERGPDVPITHVLLRGSVATPGPEVHPQFLSALGGGTPLVPTPAPEAESNGLRRALADWIASPKNPLTARVMVNRIWQHHFGTGLVATPDDFGKTGAEPSNPQLLDWLAGQFIDSGWSIKQMHRLIMTSRAYQMSSSADNPQAAAADPSNALIWRQNLRRLDAEALRDAVLSASGKLNLKVGGPSFYPKLSPQVLATQSRPGDGWGNSDDAERSRRSVYMFVKRTLTVPLMDAFDQPNSAQPVGQRAMTTVAPQALMLLNGSFIQEQATALAARVIKSAGDNDTARVDRLFELALQRRPTAQERQIAQDVLRDQRELATSATITPAKADALAMRSLCVIVLNLNEFAYVD